MTKKECRKFQKRKKRRGGRECGGAIKIYSCLLYPKEERNDSKELGLALTDPTKANNSSNGNFIFIIKDNLVYIN